MYLPKVIKYNSKNAEAAERYAEIAKFINLPGNTTEELVDALIAALREMNKDVYKRQVVVFPQPEGPSRVTNSPCCTLRLTPCSTPVSPKRFSMWSSSRIVSLMGSPSKSSASLGMGAATAAMLAARRPHTDTC